ncbi:MAG: pyrroline-5-carboxylate reductase [Oscillibacter sp.]|nr:pyrroline-5-carboxylate reductase [Oscillibacter sp.]
MATFGFIGCGNMGGALARAMRKTIDGSDIVLTNRSLEKAETLAAEIGCGVVPDNQHIAQKADYIFLGVKPQMMAEMLSGIRETLSNRTDRFILVTMAAGLTIKRIREMAGGDYPVIRIMPNTPSSIGEGMILYSAGSDVLSIELEIFLSAMSGAGRLSPLPEHLMDAGSAISGCGPAFVDLFVEALADGGVACGLPRAAALEFAAQMVAGSAKLILESGQHPGVLKDAVCSPGGTTIQGVRALEEGGFRGTVMNAVIKAYEKNFDLK